MHPVVDYELGRIPWATLRTANERGAGRFPEAVRSLLAAETQDDASEAYWQLDNSCVVSRMLFESAVPLVPVLLAALAAPIRVIPQTWVADLLIELVLGESDETEVSRGNLDLGPKVRDAAEPGLWIYYWLTSDPDPGIRDSGLTLAFAVDRDRDRVAHVLSVATGDPDGRVRQASAELSEMDVPSR